MTKTIRKITTNLTLTAYVAGLMLPVVLVARVSAQTSATNKNTANNGQALEIAPPIIYLSADPGQTIKTQISIRDISSGSLLVKGQANNFVASGEDGTPKLIFDENGESANDPHSLVSWIAPLPSLLLVPKEIKKMDVTINVPKDASPGGHYGVIRFTSQPPSVEGSGVSLSASIGTLVLVTVSGDITEKLEVQEFSSNKDNKKGTFFESTPLNFLVKVKNSGNVHEQPIGRITITDMFGKTVAGLNVNSPPSNVLPNSTRAFTQPLDKAIIGNKRLFGRYKAKLALTYGTDKKTVESVMAFWVIPYRLVAAVIAFLIIAFFGLRFLIKRYNQRILAQAQKRQNKK